MKRVIWIAAILSLLVCLLGILPGFHAVAEPAETLLAPGEMVATDQVEFVLLRVQMSGDSSVSLQYRMRPKNTDLQDGICRLDLVSSSGLSTGCDILHLNLPDEEISEGRVLWSRDGADLRRVTVTLPTASSTAQFTYAIG